MANPHTLPRIVSHQPHVADVPDPDWPAFQLLAITMVREAIKDAIGVTSKNDRRNFNPATNNGTRVNPVTLPCNAAKWIRAKQGPDIVRSFAWWCEVCGFEPSAIIRQIDEALADEEKRRDMVERMRGFYWQQNAHHLGWGDAA